MDQMMRADELLTMRHNSKGHVLGVGVRDGADVAIIKDGMAKVQRLLKSGDIATIVCLTYLHSTAKLVCPNWYNTS